MLENKIPVNVFMPKRAEVITDITYYITWSFMIYASHSISSTEKNRTWWGCACNFKGEGKKCIEKFGGRCPIWKIRRCEHNFWIDLSEMSNKQWAWMELAEECIRLLVLVFFCQKLNLCLKC